VICKLSRITINGDENPRHCEDLKSVLLFFPIDRLGNVVDVEKAHRLECWAYREDPTRKHGPDILREGWSKAVTRKDGSESFGQVKYAAAKLSLMQINEWGKHLERFPLGDINILLGA